jgi:hypothetical protein
MNSLRTTIARASSRVAHKVQKRQMASGAAQPQWTGIDKVIRDRFPEDYQGERGRHQSIYTGRRHVHQYTLTASLRAVVVSIIRDFRLSKLSPFLWCFVLNILLNFYILLHLFFYSLKTVAGLILGGYATLITIVSLKPSGSKEEPVVASKPADVSGAIPSVEDESFAEFIENEGNLQKWIDSAE